MPHFPLSRRYCRRCCRRRRRRCRRGASPDRASALPSPPRYTAFDLVSQRHIVADDMFTTVKPELAEAHIKLHDVQLISILWPSTVMDAITDTAVAVQDVETAMSEYVIAETAAETEVIAARTLAEQLVYEANATAVSTLAAANAMEADILYEAEAQANWMAYATTYGIIESDSSAGNSTNSTATTEKKTWAGTNLTTDELRDYTWLKYVAGTSMTKAVNVDKPDF